MRHRQIELAPFAALLVALAFLVWGCAGHLPPNASPEMKIAAYASDVMKGVREVQRATDALEAGHVIATADAANVMIVAELIGKGGEKLSYALAIYHNATDLAAKNLALAEVYRILDAINADIDKLLVGLDASGAKARYVDIITSMIKALWSVRIMLPAVTPVAGGVPCQ